MEQLLHVLGGFETIAEPAVFGYLVAGFLIGTLFAAIPGLTGTLAIALILPITYSMDITPSLVMCAAIFMGAQYGGSITAITVNIPGAPCAVMTAYEGNILMRRGEGARALRSAGLASMMGGVVGAVLLMTLAPIIAQAALYVQTPGKFSLILFAFFVIIISNDQSIAKGIVATLLGLMVATIGIDVASSKARQTFGLPSLVEGIDLMAVIIGAFAISELLVQVTASSRNKNTLNYNPTESVKWSWRDFLPRGSDYSFIGTYRYIKFAMIGYFVGVLPGAGGSSAAFVSYAEAKRSSSRPEEYNNGSVEGISASESANNAMCGGSLVPMLTFGIPGDTTSAVILGVLIINGLQPGPQMMTEQFAVITPMMAALLIAALLIPITLLFLGPWYMRLVSINKAVLFSSIAVVAMVGAYVSTFSVFQMGAALAIGVGAYFMQRGGYPMVSFLLGFILGPDLEVYMRRSLAITDGSPSIFFTRPDSLFFLGLIAVFFFFMIVRPWISSRRKHLSPDK
ncbi:MULTISPECIES: tripartite tricarboxylate transporter permease [Roseobacteraceae]|nr:MULTISPECIES: tripartite tricarboxylate transporter permease [Roseobacteraceae]WPZ31961.1 tripartite tricarboxylate transporter permease [Sulfitobacter sp. OXR-159]